MNRRDFLTSSVGGMVAASGILAQRAFAHGKVGVLTNKLIIDDPEALAQLAVVSKTAAECWSAGQACIQHCQEELIQGHGKEFENCSLAVHQMSVVCQTIGTLASYKAEVIGDLLDGCIKACENCRLACKEHEAHFAMGMHLQCKRCMESCQACHDSCVALKALL